MRELGKSELNAVAGGYLDHRTGVDDPFGTQDPWGMQNPWTSFNGNDDSGPSASTTTGPTTDSDGTVNGWETTVNVDTDGDGQSEWDASGDTNGNYEAGYTFDNGVRVGVYSGGDGDSGGVRITVPLGGG